MSRLQLSEPTPMCRKCGVQRHRHDDVMRVVAEKHAAGVDIGPKPHTYAEPEPRMVLPFQRAIGGGHPAADQ